MKSDTDKHLDYIRDLAYLLRERAAEAHAAAKTSESEFEDGREFGLRQALAWMQHQADAFAIPREQVCLSGFDAMTGDVQPPPPEKLEEGDTKR